MVNGQLSLRKRPAAVKWACLKNKQCTCVLCRSSTCAGAAGFVRAYPHSCSVNLGATGGFEDAPTWVIGCFPWKVSTVYFLLRVIYFYLKQLVKCVVWRFTIGYPQDCSAFSGESARVAQTCD
jgi:hypothetical protein